MYLTGRDPAAVRRDQRSCVELCWLGGIWGSTAYCAQCQKGPPVPQCQRPLASEASVLFLCHAAIISVHETFPDAELEETLFLIDSFLLPASLPAQREALLGMPGCVPGLHPANRGWDGHRVPGFPLTPAPGDGGPGPFPHCP